ncbi:hypothetical protein C8R44DRAFT_728343 [Mycena epipterygia]|nr:hypothetical protein C8R44DRAFT_728343 [Mycena epipterygia]
MAPKPWADAQHLAWLHLQLPDYIRRHAEGKLHLFWGATEEAWFARFPEQEQLGLLLPSDPNAPVLTREQVGQLGDVIIVRKKQLASWFRCWWSGVAVRRAMREDDDDEETLEEQEGHVKMSRSERMSLWNEVVTEMWAELSDEDREVVEREVETEKRNLARKQLEEEQQGIDSVENLFKDAHVVGHEMSGWVGVTIVGGPTPRMGGHICFGETANGNDFEASCADFEQTVTKPFAEFLQRIFSEAQRRERALAPEASAAEPESTSDEAAPVTTKPPAKPAAKTKPKCVPKPKASKTRTSIASSTSQVTSTTTTAGTTPIPAAPTSSPHTSGFVTPPAESQTSVFATTPVSESATSTLAVTPVSGDAGLGHASETGLALSSRPGVDGAFGVPYNVSQVPDVESAWGGSRDEDPFLDGDVGMDSAGDSWWTAVDNEWAASLTLPALDPSSPRPLSLQNGSQPAMGALPSLTHRPERPAPRACFKGAPHPNDCLGDAGKAGDGFFFTGVSQRGRPDGGAGPQTPRGSSSAYPRSILMEAFEGGQQLQSPLVGSAPASLRRKAWSSPLRPRPSVPFVSRAADAMAGILAIVHAPTTTPTPPSMMTTATPAAAPQLTPPTVTPVPAPEPRTATSPAATTTTATTPMMPTTLTMVLTTTSTTGPVAGEHMRASAATAEDADQDDDGYPQSRPAAKMPKPPGVRRAGRGRGRGRGRGGGRGGAGGGRVAAEMGVLPLGDATNQVAGAPAAEPVLVYTVGNETMKLNRQVEARQRKEALEKERVKQAAALMEAKARGYYETPNPNGETPNVVLINPEPLPERWSRRATVMRDGSAAARVVKNMRPRTNPNAASEAVLLARGTAAAEGKKRKAGVQEPGAEPPAKRPRFDSCLAHSEGVADTRFSQARYSCKEALVAHLEEHQNCVRFQIDSSGDADYGMRETGFERGLPRCREALVA